MTGDKADSLCLANTLRSSDKKNTSSSPRIATSISARTKAALAAAKKRGIKLGGNRGVKLTAKVRAQGLAARVQKADKRAADIAPVIVEIRAGGATTLQAIADALNARGIPTAKNGEWSPVQVSRVLARV